jgi:hypothetical protein
MAVGSNNLGWIDKLGWITMLAFKRPAGRVTNMEGEATCKEDVVPPDAARGSNIRLTDQV